jgi:hypothetical protein
LRRLERAAREGRIELHVHGAGPWNAEPIDPWGPRVEKEVRDLRETEEAGRGTRPGDPAD